MSISLYYFFLATNTITNTKKERERENTVLIVPTILFQDVFMMKEMIYSSTFSTFSSTYTRHNSTQLDTTPYGKKEE